MENIDMRCDKACDLWRDGADISGYSFRLAPSRAGKKISAGFGFKMKMLLRVFFSGCFIFGVLYGANIHTASEYQRIEALIMARDIKQLTLQEISQVRI